MNSTGWKKYPQEVVDRLFQAIDEDDVINNETTALPLIKLCTSQQNIRDYYALCLQLWDEGFTREELLGLINQLLAGQDLSLAQRKQYKFIRARYKHLRFAQRLYSKKHDADKIFRITTVCLGHLQDGFKNGNKKNIQHYGKILRILLSRPIWSWVKYSLENLPLDTEAGFQSYLSRQKKALARMVNQTTVTGTEFHDVRKIVSQLVSFFDTQRSIENNTPHAYAVSRFLANINGLMGDKHDEMVADKLSGTRPYETPLSLDSHTRECLEQLLEKIAHE
ncbi:hypothetical protein [Rosenbergiella australiborealis]|uniref:hypothetical protein n=1 Tax=Rosenbergiella australiborealis TaxID=1544696 RepID=UPI001F4D5458|nr:hypothetical protein [Rosenbergiella australiborealis]